MHVSVRAFICECVTCVPVLMTLICMYLYMFRCACVFMCCVICCVHVYACTFFSPAGDTDIRVNCLHLQLMLISILCFRFGSVQVKMASTRSKMPVIIMRTIPPRRSFPNVAFSFQCCCTSTETLRLITSIRDGEPRTVVSRCGLAVRR